MNVHYEPVLQKLEINSLTSRSKFSNFVRFIEAFHLVYLQEKMGKPTGEKIPPGIWMRFIYILEETQHPIEIQRGSFGVVELLFSHFDSVYLQGNMHGKTPLEEKCHVELELGFLKFWLEIQHHRLELEFLQVMTNERSQC